MSSFKKKKLHSAKDIKKMSSLLLQERCHYIVIRSKVKLKREKRAFLRKKIKKIKKIKKKAYGQEFEGDLSQRFPLT